MLFRFDESVGSLSISWYLLVGHDVWLPVPRPLVLVIAVS